MDNLLKWIFHIMVQNLTVRRKKSDVMSFHGHQSRLARTLSILVETREGKFIILFCPENN